MHFLRSLTGLELVNAAHIRIATGMVALSAGFAWWIPARHATRIDPVSALGQE
jgi:ABC-type lipoprotein release transport system permease subunit